jgi:hypothetical protein
MPIVFAMFQCLLQWLLRKSKPFYIRSLEGSYAMIRPVDPHELEATVRARQELGPGHEEELIAGFLNRMEREIDKRVDERVAARGASRHRAGSGSVLNPANLGICIPIIAIAGGIGKFPGLVLAFAVLALVFLFAEHARTRR